MPNHGEIQAFFFKAMLAGWAGGGEVIDVFGLPGHQGCTFRENGFVLLDCWSQTRGKPQSTGVTTIWHKDNPIWVMHYGGFYQPPAIPLVQTALRNAYKLGFFAGGRGETFFRQGNLAYINRPRINNFTRFEGHEEVRDLASGKVQGVHDYWGMLLI